MRAQCSRPLVAWPQCANQHLRERLADAQEELDAAHAQLRILQGLQQQLEDGTPGAAELAAAALEQEKALQAARDARVLALLKAKVNGAAGWCIRHADASLALLPGRQYPVLCGVGVPAARPRCAHPPRFFTPPQMAGRRD